MLLLLTWTAGYFAVYSILGVTRYFWYYAALVPEFEVLVGAGFNFLWILRSRMRGWLRFIIPGLLLIIFAFLILTQLIQLWEFRNYQDERILVYTEIGNWLSEHTSLETSVGALEVGAIGYYSQRKIIDFAGLIQPDIAKQLTRDTTYEDAALYAVSHYRPDYLVLNTGIFPKLRDGPIASGCHSLEAFQNGKVSVDLFECHWK
jgi:hypothetical protein